MCLVVVEPAQPCSLQDPTWFLELFSIRSNLTRLKPGFKICRHIFTVESDVQRRKHQHIINVPNISGQQFRFCDVSQKAVGRKPVNNVEPRISL